MQRSGSAPVLVCGLDLIYFFCSISPLPEFPLSLGCCHLVSLQFSHEIRFGFGSNFSLVRLEDWSFSLDSLENNFQPASHELSQIAMIVSLLPKIAALFHCWHVIGFDCGLNFIVKLFVKQCMYFNHDISSSDFWDLRARSGNLAKVLEPPKQG